VLGPGQTYPSENYAWFGARHDHFWYLDRIVVHADFRRQGVGRALYAAVFEAAGRAGTPRINCEVNTQPANPASLALHEGLGFVAVGERTAGGKTVVMLQRTPDARGQYAMQVADAQLSRAQAWSHLTEWTHTDALRRHARAVEVVMRAAAHRYGAGEADVEAWGIAGMLHDADYEQWPEEHPHRIVGWLRERGAADIAHAISAHYTKWGVSYDSAMDKALLACDELTGFIGACCLVRPEGISTLKAKSVKKKLKDKSFAAKVERDEVQKGVELLGVELGEHIDFIIEALKPHAEELGLAAKS